MTHGLELTLCFSVSAGERTLVEDFFELWTQSSALGQIDDVAPREKYDRGRLTGEDPKRKWKRSSVCGEGMADKCYLCWIWCGAWVASVDEKTSTSSLVKATLLQQFPHIDALIYPSDAFFSLLGSVVRGCEVFGSFHGRPCDCGGPAFPPFLPLGEMSLMVVVVAFFFPSCPGVSAASSDESPDEASSSGALEVGGLSLSWTGEAYHGTGSRRGVGGKAPLPILPVVTSGPGHSRSNPGCWVPSALF